jgi:hypothetical protein
MTKRKGKYGRRKRKYRKKRVSTLLPEDFAQAELYYSILLEAGVSDSEARSQLAKWLEWHPEKPPANGRISMLYSRWLLKGESDGKADTDVSTGR